MIATHILLVTAGLFQVASSLSLRAREVLVSNTPVPKEKSDFTKNNVSARWASGYPKEWGSEDYHYQFNEPDPEDNFSSGITSDEKYLAMSNGTHVTFIDLDANSTVSIITLAMPDGIAALTLMLRSAPQGGYDLFQAGSSGSKYDRISATVRIRLSSDLKPVGKPVVYQGEIGDISKQGKLAFLTGSIYDLEGTETPIATLTNQSDITRMSFSPDGVHLASVSWYAKTADLWNATSGQKIFQFPATNAQNWVTRFSPDGKYIAIALGSSNNTIQLYTIDNLTNPPIEIKGFNDWPRYLDWSPDSSTLAVADTARLRMFKVPSQEVVQKWEVDDAGSMIPPIGVSFLENGNKLTWMYRDGRYLYDFEKNTKWYWAPRTLDHIWGGNGFSFLSKKNTVVTQDGDSTVRFWKI
jgi:WD40 repeat protein